MLTEPTLRFAVHVGDAVVVRPVRAVAARRRQGTLLRRAQEVPRLPKRARGARRRLGARVSRQHQPPPAGGARNTEVRTRTHANIHIRTRTQKYTYAHVHKHKHTHTYVARTLHIRTYVRIF